MKNNETYIQIGLTALRSPLGGFLPPVPLYVKSNEVTEESGFIKAEENMLNNIAFIFASRHEKLPVSKRKQKKKE